MTQDCTYGQLQAIINDINRQCTQSPAFELFNREKIKRFYQQNAIRIQSLHDRRNKIFEANVKKDEKGEHYLQVDVDGKKDWDFISDEHKAVFEKETAEFLTLTFKINL